MTESHKAQFHGFLFYCIWGALLACLCLPCTGRAEAKAPVEVKTDVHYALDADYLGKVLPDCIGWLYQPDTDIDHPVMFSTDSSYYLRHQFNGHVGANGAIFMTGQEPPKMDEAVITLYGRNCMDRSMFGSLSLYRDDDYYQANPTLYLVTAEGNYQLDIFAGVRTRLTDNDSWVVAKNTARELYANELPRILEQSFLTPDPELLPTAQDAWAVLTTDSPEKQGNRYTLYARKRLIDDSGAPTVYMNQREMDTRETISGSVTLDGVGEWMLYAQNDPLWERLIFEIQSSSQQRPFGDGGCGPTAVAMAIVNLVDKQELCKLSQYAVSPYGYRFCSCSVNEYWCTEKHVPYQMTSTDEYFRYFPLAIANFATGNNTFDVLGRADRFGTNMSYLPALCQVYGLSMTKTTDLDEAIAFLQKENRLAIACSSGYNSPFTNSSHFLVLTKVSDGYLYMLDPLHREDYQCCDTKHYLEVMAPGLVRVRLENAAYCRLTPIYQLEREAEP